MPSATAHTPRSGRSRKASSLILRTAPTLVRPYDSHCRGGCLRVTVHPCPGTWRCTYAAFQRQTCRSESCCACLNLPANHHRPCTMAFIGRVCIYIDEGSPARILHNCCKLLE